MTAVNRIRRQAMPAALDILGECLLEARGRRDHAIVEMAAFFIATAVQRRQYVFAELRPFFEDRIDHVRAGIGGPQRGVVAVKVEDVVDQKAHVAQGSFVLGHGHSPSADFSNLLLPTTPHNHFALAECAIITQP
ncbi:hypothetical protein D9M71_304880 [compost metagenome]